MLYQVDFNAKTKGLLAIFFCALALAGIGFGWKTGFGSLAQLGILLYFIGVCFGLLALLDVTSSKNTTNWFLPTLLCATLIGMAGSFYLFFLTGKMAASFSNPILLAIFNIVLSFALLIGANWFGTAVSSEENIPLDSTAIAFSCFLRAGQWIAFCCGISILIFFFGYPQVESVFGYLAAVFVFLILLETVIQSILSMVHKTRKTQELLPLRFLPVLLRGGNPISELLISLEKNTGISLRSAWTIQFIRKYFPGAAFILALCFWLATSFVQIGPQEKGVLFTLGKIHPGDPLLPGIHLKWPYPISTVKTFPAYAIQQFTVGYESGQRKQNYLWTVTHGGEEYKLLLGDGRELVSINMQVSYQIDDLYDYILQYDNPEETLQAEAYRILLNEIVTADLDKLLSWDRASFSRLITEKLQESSQNHNLGLAVAGVELISIHPPKDVAREYQEIISANIQKDVAILKAETQAEASLPKAEQEKDNLIKKAQAAGTLRLGEATGAAKEYQYLQQAYMLNQTGYMEWKFLKTLEDQMAGKKLYLLDHRLNLNHGGLWMDLRNMNGTSGALLPGFSSNSGSGNNSSSGGNSSSGTSGGSSIYRPVPLSELNGD